MTETTLPVISNLPNFLDFFSKRSKCTVDEMTAIIDEAVDKAAEIMQPTNKPRKRPFPKFSKMKKIINWSAFVTPSGRPEDLGYFISINAPKPTPISRTRVKASIVKMIDFFLCGLIKKR